MVGKIQTSALLMTVHFIAALLMMLGAAFSNPALGDDKVVRYGVGTGFFKRFPKTDGIGWSESFFKDIVEAAGYRLEVREYPSKRLPFMLEKGDIDGFVSSTESLGERSKYFLQSKYPTTNLSYYIYYKKDNGWKPVWPPDETFLKKRGRSKASPVALAYATPLNIEQTQLFDSSIMMVHYNRTDFWLDNITGRLNATPGLIKTPEQGYIYEKLFDWGIYINFQNSARGRMLRDLYNAGFEKILMDGDYHRIYYKYAPVTGSTLSSIAGVNYIKKLFPELAIPEQKPLH